MEQKPQTVLGLVESSVRRRDGGAAFPVMPPCDMEGASASGFPYPEPGMTLRDYFAGQAMLMKAGKAGPWMEAKDMAVWCYQVADEMLAARDA